MARPRHRNGCCPCAQSAVMDAAPQATPDGAHPVSGLHAPPCPARSGARALEQPRTPEAAPSPLHVRDVLLPRPAGQPLQHADRTGIPQPTRRPLWPLAPGWSGRVSAKVRLAGRATPSRRGVNWNSTQCIARCPIALQRSPFACVAPRRSCEPEIWRWLALRAGAATVILHRVSVICTSGRPAAPPLSSWVPF